MLMKVGGEHCMSPSLIAVKGVRIKVTLATDKLLVFRKASEIFGGCL